MFNFLIPVAITYIVFSTIYKLFELFARRKERLALIDKMVMNENYAKCAAELRLNIDESSEYSALKWGSLVLGLGLGLLFAFFINMETLTAMRNFAEAGGEYFWRTSVAETQAIVYMASMMLFGGIGLIVAFVVERKLRALSREKNE